MSQILFRDLLLNMLLGLVALILIVFMYINPPTNPSKPTTPPPGAIAIMICWPEGPIDVDLWVMAPGEKAPIGYSNKSGRVWSLLRDDVGTLGDDGPSNCESAFARATPAGDYYVNIHGFNVPAGKVTVHVEISQNGVLMVKDNIVLGQKQERTVIHFKLDDKGAVVAKDNVYHPLHGMNQEETNAGERQ